MAKKVKPAKPVPPLQVQPENWAAFNVQRRKAAALKPHPRNVREHPWAQVEDITASIAEHGVVQPLVIDEHDTILAGHGRTMSVKRLGDVEVPVVVVEGWSEEQKLRFMLRDNKLAENSRWDKGGLGLVLADLKAFKAADDLGFKPAEFDRLIPKTETTGATDPDATPALAAADAQPVSRIGDVWLLGEHRIICGDSTNAEHVAAVLGGERPNLMVTDPPYGVEYDPDWRNHAETGTLGEVLGERAVGQVTNDGRADWRDAWALFAGDVAYVWHAGKFASVVQASIEAVGFEVRSQIIWAKQHFIISRGDYHWQHEPCWYAVRKGATGNWHGDRKQSTLWDIKSQIGWESARPDNADKASGHGTQKPIECMKRPIQNNSQPGDLVYDPFSGSGTTIIAAEITGRRARVIELAPRYVDVAVRRWEGFTQKRAILAAGEMGMEAVAQARGAPMPPAIAQVRAA